MRSGLRYRKNKKENAIKGKSGDPPPDPSDLSDTDTPTTTENEEESLEAWNLWPHMKFLIEGKPQRKTVSSFINEVDYSDLNNKDDDPFSAISETSPEANDHQIDSQESPLPDESPNLKPRQKEKKDENKSNYDYGNNRFDKDAATKKLLTSVNELVLRKKKSGTAKEPTQPVLQYYSIFANLDRMFRQLPQSTVEDLNIQFSNAAYAELKRQEGREVLEDLESTD